MNDKTKKLEVKDAALDDQKIPRNLILKYGETPYIMKAGLEWKANKLFGVGGYSLQLQEHYVDWEKQIFVFKAILRLPNGTLFTNYGEARVANANTMMQKQLYHLAATRAECRVLRMATACGYASYDEVVTMPERQALDDPNTLQPASKEQIETINNLAKNLNIIIDVTGFTKRDAAEKIAELVKKK